MPTASSLLCGCGRFMRVKKNSVTVEERTEAQEPYKLWSADLFACDECGVEVIAGFAQHPLVESYQEPLYTHIRDQRGPIYPGRCRAEGRI